MTQAPPSREEPRSTTVSAPPGGSLSVLLRSGQRIGGIQRITLGGQWVSFSAGDIRHDVPFHALDAVLTFQALADRGNTHDGRHGTTCLVCFPESGRPAEAPQGDDAPARAEDRV